MSRVALVTGANSGIGYELVKLLSAAGHKVYLGARSLESGNKALETLTSEGFKNIHPIQVDVTSSTSVDAARDHISQLENGKLDILVNNAGTGELARSQRATEPALLDVLHTTTDVNLFGLIRTTVAFLPLIRKSTNGVIVIVSSDMASNTLQAGPNAILPQAAAYNISKAAVNSYSIHLARELKDDGSGIKVNAVTPGFTSTKLNFFGEGGRTPKQGAETIFPWAVLGQDGPTGVSEFEETNTYIPVLTLGDRSVSLK